MKKILKNEYIFSVFSKFVSVFLSLVQSVLVARYLGAELQGVNSYISLIAGIGAIIITFGMHQAYPYFRKKNGKDKIYDDFLSLVVLLYIFFFTISFVNLFLPLSFEIRAILMLIPLFGYSKIVAYVCLVEKPNIRNLWWIIAGVLEVLLVVILFIFTRRSYMMAIVILTFSEAIKAIVYTVILKPKVRFHKGLIKLNFELIKYGFFPMLALLMTTLNYKIDVLMLKQYSFINNAMIGVYSIGIQMADRIIMIPDTLKGVLVSKLAKGSNEKEVAFVCRVSFWISIFMCVIFVILGPTVINLLYGSEYTDAYVPLLISSFGTLFISYFKLIAQYNIVNKKQVLNVYMLSVAIVTDVVFNLLFIPIWGINGAAAATGIGNFACGVVFALWFSKKANIPLRYMIIPQSSDIIMLQKKFMKNNNNVDNYNV